MPTLEGLQKAENLGNSVVMDELNQSKAGFDLGRAQSGAAAAGIAAQQFKAGDRQGAYATLMGSNPEFGAQLMPQLQKMDPTLAGSLQKSVTAGEQSALNEAGNGAAQVAGIKAKNAAASRPVVRADKNSPTGFSLLNPADGSVTPVENYGSENSVKALAAKDFKSNEQKPEGTQIKPEALKLRPNEDIDSSGNKILLSPSQQKSIQDTQKQFSSSTKDMVKGINDMHTAVDMINQNQPGGQTLEKLRMLRAITPRINQQEFSAFGKGQGVATMIDNAITEAAGKGMSAESQKNMKAIAGITLKNLSAEYDQTLQNTIETHPEVDPLVLKKRLAGSGPTPYQAIVKKVQALPPGDQGAFNWAHDNASDPRAQAILKHLGF